MKRCAHVSLLFGWWWHLFTFEDAGGNGCLVNCRACSQWTKTACTPCQETPPTSHRYATEAGQLTEHLQRPSALIQGLAGASAALQHLQQALEACDPGA